MKLYFATHNAHKLAEIRDLLPGHFELKSLHDLGVEEIEESGKTIAENSLIKAQYLFDRFGIPCFADDTGLEVHVLDGEPGVYSARYAGTHGDAEANMDLLLQRLNAHEDRSARFLTVITYIDSTGRQHQFEGVVPGQIRQARKGTAGFGYDPIFQPEGYSETFAEMSRDEKNKISHRGRAVRSFIAYLLA